VPGLIEILVWCLGFAAEVGVMVFAFRAKVFRRYLPLNLYMAACAGVELLRYQVLHSFGLSSSAYFYFYYYSDALLTITLYLALIGLFVIVFKEMSAEQYVIYGAVLLLGGTALFSYLVVKDGTSKFATTHFVVEMSQNLYFVGLILTYVLWGAILKLRETRTQLIQLVLALGVYFSLFAVNYAIRNIYPPFSSISISLLQVLGCFLPFAWAYSFWKIPKDARLAPARLTVIPR
jgi:hypothetical protein